MVGTLVGVKGYGGIILPPGRRAQALKGFLACVE
jgi:hypothetical protein